jgi:hypothetical protein
MAEMSGGTWRRVGYLQWKGKENVEESALDWNLQRILSRGMPRKFARKQFSRKS